ncbi:Uncharacterised protein [Salmonella enterica subsp. enterica serovar Typhi]|nr:Uncharacterised protein [Salmonella enterica subsp. enterica serovar Typhi]
MTKRKSIKKNQHNQYQDSEIYWHVPFLGMYSLITYFSQNQKAKWTVFYITLKPIIHILVLPYFSKASYF